MRILSYFLVMLFCLLSNPVSASAPKKVLAKLYSEHPVTFLCENPFPNIPIQSLALQWIAMVPIHYYLANQHCYTHKICIDAKGKCFSGIKCCRQKNTQVRAFEKDLHNWVPDMPEVKKLMKCYRFGQTNSSLTILCQLKIDKKNKIIEPPDKLKGMIGRTFLYMQAKYKFPLSSDEQTLYTQWHQQCPPSCWEKTRNRMIQAIQGDKNPYIG